MADLSGESLWIDDSKILQSIKNIEKGIVELEKTTEQKAAAMRTAFADSVAGGVQTLIDKLRDAKTLLDAMPEAKVAIATGSAEQSIKSLNAGLSELVGVMTKVTEVTGKVEKEGDALSKAFGTAGSGAKMLEDMVASIAKPLQETATSIKRLTDQMGVLSKADFRKVVRDTQGEGFKKIQNNVDALYEALGRLYSVQAQKGPLGLNGNEVDTIDARIKKIRKAIQELQDTAGKPAKEKPLGNILADLGKIDDAPLQRLKKGYKELLDYLSRTPVNSGAWNNAAMEMMKVGEKIDEVTAKTKLLPLGMDKFEKAIKKLDYTQLVALDRVLQDTMKAEGTSAEAMERLGKKQKLVAEAIESIDIAALKLGTDLKMLNFEMESEYVSASRLRSIFGELKNELSNASWQRGDDGRLKVQYDGLEESIQKCVVRMKEYQRAEQDVLAAAGALGQSAKARIDTVGVGNMNSVELERLAQDLKTAMRYLDEGSSEWTKYRDALKEVQGQQSRLNELMDVTEKKVKKTKEEVVYASGSLGALQKALKELNTSANKEAFGSAQWHMAARGASGYADEVDRVQRMTRLAEQGNEQFKKSLQNTKDEGALQQMYQDLNTLRHSCVKGSTDWQRYEERLRQVRKAIDDMRAAAVAASVVEPVRGLKEIAADADLLRRPLEATKRDYEILMTVMSQNLKGSPAFEEAAKYADQLAERIRVLTAEQDRYKRGLDSMTEAILKAYSGSTDGFKTMGLSELEGTVGRIKTAMDSLSRADMGTYMAQWQELNKILQAGNAEIEKMRNPGGRLVEAGENQAKAEYEARKKYLDMQLQEENKQLEINTRKYNESEKNLQLKKEELATQEAIYKRMVNGGVKEHYRRPTAEKITNLKAEIAEVERERDAYVKTLEDIGKVQNKLRNELAKPMPVGSGIDKFRESLKSLSRDELEQVIRGLERMRNTASRESDGGLSAEFKSLDTYLKIANEEMTKLKVLLGETKQYSWSGDKTEMINAAGAINASTSLQELRALQAALRAEVEKDAGMWTKSTASDVEALHKVENAIRGIEKELHQVEKAKGAERALTDIERSAASADATIKSLNQDFTEARQKLADMQTAGNPMGWHSSLSQVKTILSGIIGDMETLKMSTQIQNEALRSQVDRMSYLNREMQMTGNAAMGRWNGGKGYDEIKNSIMDTATTAERLKRDLADLQAIKDRTAKHDAAGNITKEWRDLTRLINLANKRLREYNNEKNRNGKKGSVADAIKAAETAQSYNQLTKALQRLKELQASMNPNNKYWNSVKAAISDTEKRIADLKKAMGEVGSATKKSTDVLGQLRTSLLQYFSVQAVYGFLKKMVEVHAQLRLQNVALRAIIQNKDEADRIFMQVQQMALRSPFSVMQMTTFTKQLAAYRIESDKLVGTTKMLADVSAGLGVEMGRLILAYGQVKAANYLRATEVRQFTEAGLNITGELADYYSELYGKMVSVADVTDMVTKRMVKFEDVEEVFKRVTAAGGLFYDMQKKQSDTVHGQMQRIQDAYTLMMDEIGTGNGGVIQTALTAIRELIANWRPLALMAKHAALAFGVYKVAVLTAKIATTKFGQALALTTQQGLWARSWLVRFPSWLVKITLGSRAASVALKGLSWALTGIVGIGAAFLVSEAVFKLYELATAGDAARESLARIRSEAENDSSAAVARYEVLTKKVKDVTTSTEERGKALEELNRVYGEYLPKQMLEREGIEAMGDSYEKATEAIKMHYAEVEKANRAKYYEGEYEKKLQELLKDHAPAMEKFLGVSENELAGLVSAAVKEGVEKGASTIDIDHIFEDKLTYLRGKSREWLEQSIGPSLKDLERLADAWRKVHDAMQTYELGLDGLSKEEREQRIAELKALEQRKKSWEAEKENLAKIKGAYEALKKAMRSDPKYDPSKDIEAIQKMYSDMKLDPPKTDRIKEEILKTTFGLQMEMERCGKECADNFQQGFLTRWLKIEKDDNGLITKVLGYISDKVDGLFARQLEEVEEDKKKLELSLGVDWARDVMNAEELESGFSDLFQTIGASGQATLKTIGSSVKDLHKTMKESLESYETSVMAGTTPEKAADLFLDGATVEEYKKRAASVEKVMHKLGVEESKSGKKGRDPWVERLNLIRQIEREYEKLLKYYEKDVASEWLKNSFDASVQRVFAGTNWADITQWQGFDKQSVANMISDMTNVVSNMTEAARTQMTEAYSQMFSEIGIKDQEKLLDELKLKGDELFAAFDLTKTFRELGVDDNLMVKLFGEQPMRTLGNVRDGLEAINKEAKNIGFGDDYVKWYEQMLKKITDLEAKQRQEQTKNWIKYTKEGMDEYGKAVMEAMQEYNKIKSNKGIDDETRKLAISQLYDKTGEQLSKISWERFKGTDMYIEMFENLEWASTESLRRMRDGINALKDEWGDLPPDQLKAMIKEVEKLEAQLRSRNPFKGLKKGLQEINDLQSKGRTRSNLEAEVALGTQQRESLQRQIDLLEIAKSMRTTGADDAILSEEDVKGLEQYANLTERQINDEIVKLKNLKKEKDEALSVDQQDLDKYKAFAESVEAAKEKWGEYYAAVQKAFDMVKDVLDAIGVDMDSVGGVIADGTMKLIDMAAQIVFDTMLFKALGIAIKGAMGIIGYILIALEAIATILTTILRAGDKRKEKQIERLKEKVDGLAKAYDRLKDSMDRAYKIDDYRNGARQAKVALQSQMSAYEEMLKLEKSKKKSDKAAIKEYEEKILELQTELRDLADEQTKALGGIGKDTRFDAAEAFVEAWLDAYKETGDGLDALEEKWDGYIENLFKKQAAYRIAGKRLERFYALIDEAANAYTSGTIKEIIEKANALEGDLLSKLNDELKEYFDYLGINGNGDLLLSDLQQGIRNITEEQAAALESIANSMRFGIWRGVDLLGELVTAVRGQQGAADMGQLAELKSIRTETAEIRSLLNSVIRKTGSADGRPYIRIG